MNMNSVTVRAGMKRGAIEFRNSLKNPADVTYYIIGNAIFVAVLILNRDNMIEEVGMPLTRLIFPGVLAMIIVFITVYGLATLIATEREDGTLLRMKSIPHGMTGYVIGQSTRTSLELAFSAVILTTASTILIPGVWDKGAVAVLGVVGLLIIGLLASLPLGFALGSLFPNPRALGGWGFIILGGLIAISGLFAPLITMPVWVQIIGQIFPLYWLGLGMRSAVLPDSAVAIEIGESWRTLETIGVLGLWAVVGLLLAPVLLRRMARRESGSAMEARRTKVLQRIS
jgi:ABC-2 type transport system permease protein